MNNFKLFAKYILLAKVASDSGKWQDGYISNNTSSAIAGGYDNKDGYIRQAVSICRKLEGIVSVNQNTDDNCYGMNVILFEIRGYGQISFHSNSDFRIPFNVLDCNIEWDGIRGGSGVTCAKLARKLNLPHHRR